MLEIILILLCISTKAALALGHDYKKDIDSLLEGTQNTILKKEWESEGQRSRWHKVDSIKLSDSDIHRNFQRSVSKIQQENAQEVEKEEREFELTRDVLVQQENAREVEREEKELELSRNVLSQQDSVLLTRNGYKDDHGETVINPEAEGIDEKVFKKVKVRPYKKISQSKPAGRNRSKKPSNSDKKDAVIRFPEHLKINDKDEWSEDDVHWDYDFKNLPENNEDGQIDRKPAGRNRSNQKLINSLDKKPSSPQKPLDEESDSADGESGSDKKSDKKSKNAKKPSNADKKSAVIRFPEHLKINDKDEWSENDIHWDYDFKNLPENYEDGQIDNDSDTDDDAPEIELEDINSAIERYNKNELNVETDPSDAVVVADCEKNDTSSKEKGDSDELDDNSMDEEDESSEGKDSEESNKDKKDKEDESKENIEDEHGQENKDTENSEESEEKEEGEGKKEGEDEKESEEEKENKEQDKDEEKKDEEENSDESDKVDGDEETEESDRQKEDHDTEKENEEEPPEIERKGHKKEEEKKPAIDRKTFKGKEEERIKVVEKDEPVDGVLKIDDSKSNLFVRKLPPGKKILLNLTSGKEVEVQVPLFKATSISDDTTSFKCHISHGPLLGIQEWKLNIVRLEKNSFNRPTFINDPVDYAKSLKTYEDSPGIDDAVTIAEFAPDKIPFTFVAGTGGKEFQYTNSKLESGQFYGLFFIGQLTFGKKKFYLTHGWVEDAHAIGRPTYFETAQKVGPPLPVLILLFILALLGTALVWRLWRTGKLRLLLDYLDCFSNPGKRDGTGYKFEKLEETGRRKKSKTRKMKDAIPRLLKRNTKAASLRHKTLSTFDGAPSGQENFDQGTLPGIVVEDHSADMNQDWGDTGCNSPLTNDHGEMVSPKKLKLRRHFTSDTELDDTILSMPSEEAIDYSRSERELDVQER